MKKQICDRCKKEIKEIPGSVKNMVYHLYINNGDFWMTCGSDVPRMPDNDLCYSCMKEAAKLFLNFIGGK